MSNFFEHAVQQQSELGFFRKEAVSILGQVISVIIFLTTLVVLSYCFIVVIIYGDSFLFAFTSAIIRYGVGSNRDVHTCQGVILVCLTFYFSTKVLIYYYFVEKARIVRGSRKPRSRDKLYQFNVWFAIGLYVVLVVLCFVWRIYYIKENGLCVIGVERRALIPLITWDLMINVYLTALFLNPLRKLYSFRYKTKPGLRTIALRTFIGSCVTLTTSIANIVVILALKGEYAWICLMLCNSDILCDVLMLHWVGSCDMNRSSPQPKGRQGSQDINYQPEFHTVNYRREGSLDTNGGKWDWEQSQTVQTRIVAEDDSYNVSMLDPKRISVRTRHEREESPVPLKEIGRSGTWSTWPSAMARGSDARGRAGG